MPHFRTIEPGPVPGFYLANRMQCFCGGEAAAIRTPRRISFYGAVTTRRHTRMTNETQKLKLSIDEIGHIAGETRSSIYAAIRAGHLTTFLVGRRRFARPAAVTAWVDMLQVESDAGRPVHYFKAA